MTKVVFASVAFASFLVLNTTLVLAGTIYVSLPLSGDFKELGEDFRKGVELAAREIGKSHEIVFIDDGCDPETTEQAAISILNARPDIVTGFLCNDPAIVTATKLAETKIPVIVSNARSIRLIKDREREGWNIWRLAPGDDYPVRVTAEAISKRWSGQPFAIVDDGTIYGRNQTDQLRLLLEDAGLAPQITDSFRAAQSTQAGLLRRLQRSGVSAAFIASATLEDLLTIAIDAKRLDTGIELMFSEAFLAAAFLQLEAEIPKQLTVVGVPDPNDPALETLLDTENLQSSRLLYEGYATIQIAVNAMGADADETTTNLSSKTFDTVLGEVTFNSDGSASYNPYSLIEWDKDKLVPATTKAVSQ